MPLEREHVIPRCLYPASKAQSRVQRITVPACAACNRGWSDDEVHFRNVMLVAGRANAAVDEVWRTAARRSFRQLDAGRRLQDLVRQMHPVQVEGQDGWMIYPADDPRVLRVVRKVVRGLSHFHGIASAVAENRVWADVLKYRIPDELAASIHFQHREPDVCEYWYEACGELNLSSAWLVRFYGRCEFIAAVSSLPAPSGNSPADS